MKVPDLTSKPNLAFICPYSLAFYRCDGGGEMRWEAWVLNIPHHLHQRFMLFIFRYFSFFLCFYAIMKLFFQFSVSVKQCTPNKMHHIIHFKTYRPMVLSIFMVACDHFHYLHNSLCFIKLKVYATNHLIPVTFPMSQ